MKEREKRKKQKNYKERRSPGKWHYILGAAGVIAFSALLSLITHYINGDKDDVYASEYENGIETDIVFADPSVSANGADDKVAYPDYALVTEEDIKADEAFTPEGAKTYEIDEEEPYYHVNITNIEEISDNYNDLNICFNLKYYLQLYFETYSHEYDKYYEVTIVEGSCENSDDSAILTAEAEVDKYPGIMLHIEYDKLNKNFGISSVLLDLSLDKQLEMDNGDDYIEFDPKYDDGSYQEGDVSDVLPEDI